MWQALAIKLPCLKDGARRMYWLLINKSMFGQGERCTGPLAACCRSDEWAWLAVIGWCGCLYNWEGPGVWGEKKLANARINCLRKSWWLRLSCWTRQARQVLLNLVSSFKKNSCWKDGSTVKSKYCCCRRPTAPKACSTAHNHLQLQGIQWRLLASKATYWHTYTPTPTLHVFKCTKVKIK